MTKDDIGKEITVYDLAILFKDLTVKGYGDMKIKTKDGTYICNDELTYDFMNREIMIRGSIFNQPIYDRFSQLKDDIQTAFDKFYEYE